MVETTINRADANVSLVRIRTELASLIDHKELDEDDYLYMIHHLNLLDIYINSRKDSDKYDD